MSIWDKIVAKFAKIFGREAVREPIMVPQCPSCHNILDAWPTRRKKCPSCSNLIIIRTIDKQRQLVTAAEAALIDTERHKRAFRNKLLNILGGTVSSHEEYIRIEKCFSLSQPDVMTKAAYRLLFELITKFTISHDYDGVSRAYSARAWVHILEETSPIEAIREREKWRLVELESRGYTYVKVWIDCSCVACAKVNGTELSIAQALKRKLLPVEECINGKFIHCSYHGSLRDLRL
jgi:hypothetical protein